MHFQFWEGSQRHQLWLNTVAILAPQGKDYFFCFSRRLLVVAKEMVINAHTVFRMPCCSWRGNGTAYAKASITQDIVKLICSPPSWISLPLSRTPPLLHHIHGGLTATTIAESWYNRIPCLSLRLLLDLIVDSHSTQSIWEMEWESGRKQMKQSRGFLKPAWIPWESQETRSLCPWVALLPRIPRHPWSRKKWWQIDEN